jgi:hypothetical protein
VTLSQLVADTKRVALVGLAKNTGKTQTLTVLLRELELEGRRVGVTSVGRDGEERDVIDSRIEKPRVRLPAGSLVATTDGLLRASAIPHELLEETNVRTPLGRVLVARLSAAGTIEIAGPSGAADVRAVSDAMLAHGAGQVLVDGAVDRRAASSPEVSEGLLMATGAVLDRDIDEVVLHTRDAVELVRLPVLDDASETGRSLRAQAARAPGTSLLLGDREEPVALRPRFVLSAGPEEIAQLLDANPGAGLLFVAGALPDHFLRSLLHPLHHRRRELVLVVCDPTRVFLLKRGPEWYRRQGVQLLSLRRIELEAITVNPVAPQSHRFDSAELRSRLEHAIADVPVLDVMHPDYLGASLLAK